MKNRNQMKQTYLKASESIENRRNKNLKSHITLTTSYYSGITLIALVVTVAVLLILTGITITLMFGENNIFDLAKEAGNKTNEAIKSDQAQIDELNKWLTENGWSSENGGSGENPEDPDVQPTPSLPEGWDENKVSIVPGTENKPVPLPNGFVKSGVDGEQNVNTGLVIYQIPEADRTDDIWTKNETGNANILDVQEKYNQFVWVPVETSSEMFGTNSDGDSLGKLYNFNATDGIKANNWIETRGDNSVMYWNLASEYGSYREPDTIITHDNTISNYTNANIKDKNGNAIINDTQFKTQLQEEFEAMRQSVETYGGFYIGRYETGNWHESQNAYGNTKAVVVRGNNDISATSTGENADLKATWYAYYQKSKEVVNEENIKSSMIWGCQWDATLKWFISSGNKEIEEITNSSNWGNYGTNIENVTGSSDTYQANQIYDMAGNTLDWTIEVEKTNTHVLRGGNCNDSGSEHPVSKRIGLSPIYCDKGRGSRLSLYM